jgi:outer membrane protein assembly factor BamB
MFCSRCGHEVGEAESYCPGCRLALSPATIASSPPMLVDGPGQPAWLAAYDGEGGADLVEGPARPGRGGLSARQRRRVALLGIGAIVVALIATVAWFAAQDRSPGSLFLGSYGRLPLAHAVTSTPHPRWQRDLVSDSGTGVVLDRGVTFISTGDDRGAATRVVAIDDDGEERWSIQRDQRMLGITTSPDHRILLLVALASDAADEGVQAVSVDDGSLLWESWSGQPIEFTDKGLLVYGEDNRLLLLDTADGHVVWELSRGEAVTTSPDRVLIVENGRLTAYDPNSGERRWTVEDGVPCTTSADGRCEVTAADDVVLVVGDTDAVAYDSHDGTRLWTETIGRNDVTGVMGTDLVFLAHSERHRDRTDWSLTTYDRDGKRDTMSADDAGDGFAPFGIRTEGRSYLFDYAAQDVYDTGLERLAHYDGDLTLTGGGVYTLDRDDLSYYRFDRTKPVWTLGVPPNVESVTAGDHAVVLVWSHVIALYR